MSNAEITAQPQHQPQQQCFTLTVGTDEARLEYRLSAGQVVFTSTYVPFSLRGRGLAEQLVTTGLAWAKEEGLEVQSSCWYVDRFLSEKPAKR